MDKYPGASKKISIHALREEGDEIGHAQAVLARDFYPRPPRGGRLMAQFLQFFQIRISIHALREEGDNSTECNASCMFYFYPRPPRGGRHGRSSTVP